MGGAVGMGCVVAIVVAGMPGSGKGVFSEVAAAKGFEVFVMGDVIRGELARRGLPITRENMAYVARELREVYGGDVVARKTVEEILSRGSSGGPGCRYVVIDGSRSLLELEYFRRVFHTVVLVAIHASPETRYKRLASRGRSGDPRSWDEFVARDAAELSLGVGGLIAMADIMIVNDGIGLEEFRRRASEALDYIRERWGCSC